MLSHLYSSWQPESFGVILPTPIYATVTSCSVIFFVVNNNILLPEPMPGILSMNVF